MRSIRHGFAIAVLSLFATSAFALEKSVETADAADPSDWFAGSTCSVVYYNFCTGWVFSWSGWGDGDVIGNVVEPCCPNAELVGAELRIATGAPTGYGFTGSIALYAADANDCPAGAPLASQPYLPTSGWQPVAWGVAVPSRFVMTVTMAGDANPTRHRTDHPSAGPTGPEACGSCYPTTRETRSFAYGTTTSPICPGSVFDDDMSVCNAELMWDYSFTCPVSVEDSSFGKVKSLYR